MHNEKRQQRSHGPGRGPGAPVEQAKDFKASMKRLLKELNSFKVLIIVALVLAGLSSILSIVAPNSLSKLTDEISKGLVINTDNMDKLTKLVMVNLNEEKIKEEMPNILDINIDENKVNEVMTSDISSDDKENFQNFIKDKENMSKNIATLPKSILNIILSDSEYKGIKVLKEDKIELLSSMNKENNIDLPKNILKAFFVEIKFDDKVITVEDQIILAKVMGQIKEDSESTDIYKNISKLPTSIQKIIEPTMNMNNIKNISLFIACLYICSALFNYIQSISMTKVSNKFAKKLRTKISIKINKLPLKYFDTHSTGDILSRVTNDIDTIAQTMNNSLATLVSSITLFLGCIIMMFVTNWVMAITAIVSSLLGFGFMTTILSKSQKYFIARQTNLGNLNGHIEEIYSGLNVVKSYNGIKESDKVFDELNEKMFEANQKSQFLSGLMMPMMGFIGNFGYVAVCIVGALLVMNGNISFGVIVAFITYVRLFTNPLSQIAQAMTSLQSTAAASERVFEFIDEEEMSNQEEIKENLNKEKVKGKIEFKNVEFTYDGNEKPTIKNFSAIANPGDKIAIVGPTGAGKTTMVNLLMKFYEINSGDIIIDGISINDLSRENIHDLFTMVLQDTWLFNGTVKENIIYNRENITDEKVVEICKTVGLHHFIKTLPKGYDSILSDNDSVSVGQRQLLTIARGMTENAPFLILDEATSSVDTRTEELVQKAMDKLTEGKTSFIIAHRLSTIKDADMILVMKDGNIIEQGNHEDLIEKNEFYAELYNSQFKN